MAKTKLTINNNGSVKIEGDFEIVDRSGNPYGLGGARWYPSAAAGFPKTSRFATARTTAISITMP
jgi:hypothetical protein